MHKWNASYVSSYLHITTFNFNDSIIISTLRSRRRPEEGVPMVNGQSTKPDLLARRGSACVACNKCTPHNVQEAWLLSVCSPKFFRVCTLFRYSGETFRTLCVSLTSAFLLPKCSKFKYSNKRIVFNFGFLHPVACVRSGDGGFNIRLRNVTIVG
jgi:hypothetical protein